MRMSSLIFELGHIPGQPRNLEIELLGEAGVREGPGNGLGDDSVDGTVDAARGVPQIHQDSSEIKCPPLTCFGTSTIVSGTASTAMGTALLQTLVRTKIEVGSYYSVAFTDVKVMNYGEIFDMKEFRK